jgi:hypothetical protein
LTQHSRSVPPAVVIALLVLAAACTGERGEARTVELPAGVTDALDPLRPSRAPEYFRRATAAAGLPPLRDAPLEPGEREVRIWPIEGLGGEELLVRVREHNGVVRGEAYRVYVDRHYRDDPTTPEEWAQRMGDCVHAGRAEDMAACRLRPAVEPDWKGLLAVLDRVDAWSFPAGADLQPDTFYRRDAMTLRVESRWDDGYHHYTYHRPHARPGSLAKRARQIYEAARWYAEPPDGSAYPLDTFGLRITPPGHKTPEAG